MNLLVSIKMFKRCFAITIILTIAFYPNQAKSEVLGTVKRVSKSEASHQLVIVDLHAGYGVNLSFPKEVIHKVWLDNPGIASLDSNGCLSGLGRSCQQSGANVLHLRSIKPIKIPGLIPTNNSLLTVITSGKDQKYNIYTFKITTKSSNQSNIRTVEVIPDNQLNPKRLRSILVAQKDYRIIHSGLIVALNKKLIQKQSPLWERIFNFSNKLRQGEAIETAANSAGISMELVKKLQEYGRADAIK